MAISGEGFFILSPSETNANALFTRNGEFGVDTMDLLSIMRAHDYKFFLSMLMEQ